jgi:hypothetical protein
MELESTWFRKYSYLKELPLKSSAHGTYGPRFATPFWLVDTQVLLEPPSGTTLALFGSSLIICGDVNGFEVNSAAQITNA